MRRKDREVTEIKDIIAILEKCSVCRLGLCLENKPYVVPLNFGYVEKESVFTFYLHGAQKGKKMDIIEQNPYACLEFDCEHLLVATKKPEDYTMKYASIIAYGKLEKVETQDKNQALALILAHYGYDKKLELEAELLKRTNVLKFVASELTAKRHS